MSFASSTAQAQFWFYRHKSEAKLTAMTPEQHVDEWIKEYFHRFDLLDEQRGLIEKHIELDGLKALPRIIEYMDKCDSVCFRKGNLTHLKFVATWMLLSTIDNHVVRLRASEEGKKAIAALERSIEQMRLAGFAEKKDAYDPDNGFYEGLKTDLKQLRGVNYTDDSIQDTFRFVYKIKLSDAGLLDFSNYLTEHYPEYPRWSKGKSVKDDTEIGPAGYPVINVMLVKPERYYKAYLEFKKTK